MATNIQMSTISLSADIKDMAMESAKKVHRSLSNYIEYLILKDAQAHTFPEVYREPNDETIEAMEEALRMSSSDVEDIDLSSNESFLKSI
ncbi:MAG: hypothetical protein CSA05_03610 [Bacteroidia bacterium]|nr:MAG: hypothetical protein CSA05_03610 [Bacteroidia bacterium]